MHVNECQHHLSKYKFIHTSNQSFIQVNYLHENMCWQGKSGLCSNKLTIDTDDLCALCLFYGKKNNTTNHLVVNSRCLVYLYVFFSSSTSNDLISPIFVFGVIMIAS